jgi:hypothetical protein
LYPWQRRFRAFSVDEMERRKGKGPHRIVGPRFLIFNFFKMRVDGQRLNT